MLLAFELSSPASPDVRVYAASGRVELVNASNFAAHDVAAAIEHHLESGACRAFVALAAYEASRASAATDGAVSVAWDAREVAIAGLAAKIARAA